MSFLKGCLARLTRLMALIGLVSMSSMAVAAIYGEGEGGAFVQPSYTSATAISEIANQWHNRVSTTDAYNVTDSDLTVSITSATSGSAYSLTFTSTATTSSFIASDLYVTGGALSGFSGSGQNYAATLTASSPGAAVSIIVPASGFQDNDGNNNTQASLFFQTRMFRLLKYIYL